jgi:hypothetical protein
MKWQPIETAPKDGTLVLLAGGHDDNVNYTRDEKLIAFMQAPCRAVWTGESWLIGLSEACCVGTERENPTHWMPLPEPPLRAGGGER